MRKTHIVGNWKMNQNLAEINSFASAVLDMNDISCEAWIAPQAIHISKLKELIKTIKVGAQNCSNQNSGAYTGELSPESLKDLGAHFVIIGHSERRAIFNEADTLLNEKVLKALENGLKAILCVGETLEERESGEFKTVLKNQLLNGLKGISSADQENILIAYEPVWAIGTGKVATPEQAQEVHAFLRNELKSVEALEASRTPILYGGSVKPDNIQGLLENTDIDGALVGGASLKGESFKDLCQLSK
ncbi:triose-phosphate isomerase [Halobacteriovorax sp. JY17]|uniref:triose-phosphate isomerase n=1 Tax=Halobacteriovorax sp. JY17 TaxID=2014617 RepID=UPI000C4574EC|nr:triose-phosphate isomerase [Halobacteriovorax sp. JY17]PIK13826.1 MAG: triose-phosphate isomerase [Halobacteriovorax sp. JY17]